MNQQPLILYAVGRFIVFLYDQKILMSFLILHAVLIRMIAQVEHSGHRIPHDPAGKMRESHRIP